VHVFTLYSLTSMLSCGNSWLTPAMHGSCLCVPVITSWAAAVIPKHCQERALYTVKTGSASHWWNWEKNSNCRYYFVNTRFHCWVLSMARRLCFCIDLFDVCWFVYGQDCQKKLQMNFRETFGRSRPWTRKLVKFWCHLRPIMGKILRNLKALRKLIPERYSSIQKKLFVLHYLAV